MLFITRCLAVLCTVLLVSLTANAQSLTPKALVEQAVAGQSFEESFPLFDAPKSAAPVAELAALGADYEVFDLNAKALADLTKSAPDNLELTLPGKIGKVQLVRADIFTADFRITESGTNGYTKAPIGLHYRGVVADEANTIVAISVFDGEVTGMIGTAAGNYVVGKLQDKSGRHVIYNDKDLPTADLGECGTPDSGLPYSAKDLAPLDLSQKDANNCVNIYMEVDNSIYADKGAGTTAFITGLFNEVAVLYANESINIKMSELFIWTTADPYNSTGSGGNLDAFRATRTSFNGNVAHLVSYQASGGVAYVDVLCSNNYGYGFSSIPKNYATVPTYSWAVNVVAHELGHNFGSQHTHACVWNGNNTPIDGCYAPQGNCARPSGLPANGGTIMSYCHLTSAGVNFNNGFGPQPGNLIRNRAYNGSCLTVCDTGSGGGGGGGGGGGTPPNPDCGEVTVTIQTDNYPGETKWTITTASGAEVMSGDSYTGRNTAYTETDCLPEGCYTFTITDSYGDGICCAYGNGSFTINTGGSDALTGGQFAESTSGEFCVTNDNAGDGGGDGGGGGGGDDGPCAAIDFTANPPVTYGGTQDKGTVTVNNANEIVLQGNSWKAIAYDYQVTANTVVELEFGSTVTGEGEIQGFGFDNNNSLSSGYSFKLHGTQRWGIRDFDNYDTPGAWKFYSIPVGQFYTGTFNRLTFIMDQDSGSGGNAFFRNIRIYENNVCASTPPVAGQPLTPVTENIIPEVETLSVFPNPASDVVNLEIGMPAASDAAIRVYDLTGRTVSTMQVNLAAGEQRLALPVGSLPVGTYLLRLDANSGYAATAKFTVAR